MVLREVPDLFRMQCLQANGGIRKENRWSHFSQMHRLSVSEVFGMRQAAPRQ